ncbi:MAG: Fe/S biogenesis protein NfuA [Proteobacteria bacterium]|nr:MAG: Fe/S biogenesis protein NfuA [Pseudomonadota bacterium]
MTETVISIKTEKTPNPNTLKYNFNRVILPTGSAEFLNEKSAKLSPLAARVFQIEGVERVFIGTDFIAISKLEGVEWSQINQYLAPKLEDFFESGEQAVAMTDDMQESINLDDMSDEEKETVKEIQKIIDEKVKPAVAQDGGDIVLAGYKNKIVYVKMLGACSGCPSAGATLKDGVENMMKYYLQDKVEQVVELKG